MRLQALVVILALFFAASVQAAVIDIPVLPEGDGIQGKDISGPFNIWSDSAFDADASPNVVYHYQTSVSEGSYRNTYLQFGIGGFSGSAPDIVSASFNFNLLSTTSNPSAYYNSGGTLYHASDSSGATGNASQAIGGNQLVESVFVGQQLGWTSFDVTDYIKADVANGYAWSAFSFNQTGFAGFEFSSGEDEELAPYLSIVTAGQSVPLPGAVWLLGFGLAGLLGLRRKSRA